MATDRKRPLEEDVVEELDLPVQHSAKRTRTDDQISPPKSKAPKRQELEGITKDEVDLYDRQIRLWGLEAQQRMRTARILVAGLNGLGNEICKNLVLAGIGALTILEPETVNPEDLGAQFFLREEDIGKNRGEAAAPRIQALNPRVELKVISKPLSEQPIEFLKNYDIVTLCNADLQTMNRTDKACRAHNIKLYCAGTHGATGYIFCDLLKHGYVEERKSSNKEDSKVERIEKEATFASLERALQHKWGVRDLSQLSRKQKRAFANASDPVFFISNVLWRFQDRHGRLPDASEKADEKEILSIKQQYFSEIDCDPESLPDDELMAIARTSKAEINPVCAILGGFTAQDILKVLSMKDAPIQNFFCFNGDEFAGRMIVVPAPEILPRPLSSDVVATPGKQPAVEEIIELD
ncbi:hypothetical protein DFS34DRAFT_383186 [Phlyctochytrium arcticum]|nr:hypothetical protein DFS34DRAFT_383186 [Phlyctochytrium arcticum]